MAGSRGFFPLPASLSLFSACVCVSTCLPTHTLSLTLSLSSSPLPYLYPPFSRYITSSLFRLPCLSARWGSQKEHLANTDVVSFSLSHRSLPLLLLFLLLPPSSPSLTPFTERRLQEWQTRLFQQWEEGGRGGGGGKGGGGAPPHQLHLHHSLPSSLPSLLSSPFTRQEVLFRRGAACTCPSEPVTPHFFLSLSKHIEEEGEKEEWDEKWVRGSWSSGGTAGHLVIRG